MGQHEMLRTILFFNEMEKMAKDKIRKNGGLKAAMFALTDKTENGRNTVATTQMPNFMEKNGAEFLMAAVQLAMGMKKFLEVVEEEEKAKVVAVFHCELMNEEDGQRLYTMRKMRMDDDESNDIVRIFKLVRNDSSVDEDGNIVVSEPTFVLEED